MDAAQALQAAEEMAGRWPCNMPGHVNFGAQALDVDGVLPDGAHRLEGSPWQMVVEGGRIVVAVREDLQAWWTNDYALHEPAAQKKRPAAKVDSAGTGDT